ncbi:BgTH12-00857 [Blumeria graminis f. sp. triticale]|uniref:Bgt-4927 n=2 Tax=Blumeria graminis TaxID=34373 RepID=A0A9X9MMN0_BLUGR|nr:BgTH12-00857 [Blumeria graminis f. sp. triticale]VDB93413.1 Bgt-4927 [Blumeria graminis f. sp. tritici]
MPYTSPSSRSPATSASQSPNDSRRPSFQTGSFTSPKSELPRSASYLSHHRRSASLKAPVRGLKFLEPPPEWAGECRGLKSGLRQSPPPITQERLIPTGAVISPPESSNNSSDDESRNLNNRYLRLENLVELKAAIHDLEQHRSEPHTQLPLDSNKTDQAVILLAPAELKKIEKSSDDMNISAPRRLAHYRAKTEGVIFNLSAPPTVSEKLLTGSDDENLSDDEDLLSVCKPPMVRKKSGELVRPALRPSSARRRPSSMPGTPTFSKAVHFDSQLEHIRHFLQVDRPLAVSAGSSPVPAYDSDNEFPFGEDERRDSIYEWEIVVANFPPETSLRLAQAVRVERVFLSSDNKTLVGMVAVANLAFNKLVVVRFTLDYWKTTSEVVAEFNQDLRQPAQDGYDRFHFNIKLTDQANLEAKTMFFCVKYCVNGVEYWDNNDSTNFQVDFRKKKISGKGAKRWQDSAKSSRQSLPRSSHRSPALRPRSIPMAFDDFSDGFSDKYALSDFKNTVRDYLGEATALDRNDDEGTISRSLEGHGRRHGQTNGNVFGNRYDFGASLTAAIKSANLSGRDRCDGYIPKKATWDESVSPLSDEPQVPVQSDGPDKTLSASYNMARRNGAEKPCLSSQSYNELLDKYCFFGSTKGTPQLKDDNVHTSAFSSRNNGAYDYGSTNIPTSNSPGGNDIQHHLTSQNVGARRSRSPSPGSTTGFVSGMFPMYQNFHDSFPFLDAHAATAIRGQ